MKNLGLTLIALLIFACSDNDDSLTTDIPELEVTWWLVEQYADPGDGSGDFTGVDSEKTIQFLQNGIFRSNGRLCNLNTITGPNSSGKYVLNDTLTKFSFDNY
ncbi:MAG: hypothetical protein HKN31_00655 [Pricia sp.]|nr:hypothetical protein [Pricia sp.]